MEEPQPPRIVLCAVGPWATLDQLRVMLRVADADLELDDEGHLCCTRTGAVMDAVFQGEPDPRMLEAFQACATPLRPPLDEDYLEAVDAHTAVLYVLSDPYGPEEAAEVAHRMLHVARALTESGAFGLKCESSAVAHSPDRWEGLAEEADAALRRYRDDPESPEHHKAFWRPLVEAWVRLPLLSDEGLVHSCGMHLLGAPDGEVALREGPVHEGDLHRAAHDLQVLLATCLLGGPVQPGQPFQADEDGPTWRVEAHPCTGYPPGDLFWNPYGQLRLVPVD